MPRVWISVELSQVLQHPRPKRIEMKIPDEFEEVWFLLAND
jgi:hypothetical protein